MRIIGFNFSKVSAEKFSTEKPENISNNIEFLEVSKEEVGILKDNEALKIVFKFSINYEDTKKKDIGLVEFIGDIILALPSDLVKESLKTWKKKELPNGVKIDLFNAILRRCSVKALDLEDQVGLPPHFPLPQINLKQD
jgi:hypothetical protein